MGPASSSMSGRIRPSDLLMPLKMSVSVTAMSTLIYTNARHFLIWSRRKISEVAVATSGDPKEATLAVATEAEVDIAVAISLSPAMEVAPAVADMAVVEATVMIMEDPAEVAAMAEATTLVAAPVEQAPIGEVATKIQAQAEVVVSVVVTAAAPPTIPTGRTSSSPPTREVTVAAPRRPQQGTKFSSAI